MNELPELLSIKALFDIRVETLAAALLAKSEGNEESFELEQVVVSPIGHAKRRSSHEVNLVRRKYYDSDTALLLEVSRKGLFDTLPGGLFIKLDKPYKNALEKTRDIDRQIKDARKFFLPFEQAMYHPRIESDILEQKWTEGFPDFIKKIWGLPAFGACLDDRQRFLLCYLLPEAYRVVGNWQLTGLCFEAVLQKPVELNFIAPLKYDIPNSDTPASECRLGEEAILGDSFKDDMPALEVRIKGITLRDLPGYLPEGDNLRILEELLYSYFIPLDVAIVTKIVVTDDAWSGEFGKAVLGYNFILN